MSSWAGRRWARERLSGAPPQPPDAAKNPWAYNLTVDGYIIPNDQSYVDPVFTADRGWLHLEARYNYENLQDGVVVGQAITSAPAKSWCWTSRR